MRSERVSGDEGRVTTATAEGRKETKDAEVEGGGEDGGRSAGREGAREQVCWLTPARNLLHHVHLRRSPEGPSFPGGQRGAR